MKLAALSLLFATCLGVAGANARITSFQHIVVVFQENRTPDNLFYALCAVAPCSTHPDDQQYNIQTSNWLDKNSPTGFINPVPEPLASNFDPSHRHADFVAMCDGITPGSLTASPCKMDGAGDIRCTNCPPNAQFTYVGNSTGILDPYITLAAQYGWANYMFQTNQGPSFPAHQFIFGATSAPSAKDDHKGIFVSENLVGGLAVMNGCLAPKGSRIQLIGPGGVEESGNQIYPCFEHQTIPDILTAETWRYYAPGAGDLWTAPDAIRHICEPVQHQCTGSLWNENVDLVPSDVLRDVLKCNLRQVSWVIPTGQNSDHPKSPSNNTGGGGPSWVASIVNTIGNSSCSNPDGSSYWDTTAIVIAWDDWGGFYDHEPPDFLPYPEGGYQYGFRVPMIFVSAYTPVGYVNNTRQDFGSIVRFIEFNFGIKQGSLTFADARSTTDLAHYYDLSKRPRTYQTIPAPKSAEFFLNDKSTPLPPDDD